MQCQILETTGRSAVVKIEDGGDFYTKEPYEIRIDQNHQLTTNRSVTSLFGLDPDSDYLISISKKGYADVAVDLFFRTEEESFTLNVKDFGAKGDGIHLDTPAIQAAILACPENGRIYFPKGTFLSGALFLKSHVSLELSENAELLGSKNREHYPILPGMIQGRNEKEEWNLGSWEGNPLDMYAALITGIGVKDIKIYGQGKINGNACFESWWKDPKQKSGAFRPRLIFLNRCKEITFHGLQLENSPSWTIHPYFSKDLEFFDLKIRNPENSPNTDGLDPESCKNVVICGVDFSLGDDCIAIKSGKIYMGKTYRTPSKKITISHCKMENGHGAVTIGSEMSGGVEEILVKNCLFVNTDRGLRIKTRRGRGCQGRIDQILFEKITMDRVKTPFVLNSFYFCDPDGRTEYVQTREYFDVDERTPSIGTLTFHDINCENAQVAAGYFEGLPEQKIEGLYFKNVRIHFAKLCEPGVAAMTEGVSETSRGSMKIKNVCLIDFENVEIKGVLSDDETENETDIGTSKKHGKIDPLLELLRRNGILAEQVEKINWKE